MSEHGTASRFRYGCHCAECRTAYNAYMRRYRATTKRLRETRAAAAARRESA